MDPELARYLNRNYWQQKHEDVKVTTTTPSAPVATTTEPKTTTASREETVEEVGLHLITYFVQDNRSWAELYLTIYVYFKFPVKDILKKIIIKCNTCFCADRFLTHAFCHIVSAEVSEWY